MGFSDFAEGFASGFVPTFTDRMARQEQEDEDLVKLSFQRLSSVQDKRTEASAAARARSAKARNLAANLGGDESLFYGLLGTYDDDAEFVTKLIQDNPNAIVPTASPAASVVPSGVGGVQSSLRTTESSNNPTAFRTNQDGRSFGGLVQMGAARLTDYSNATGAPAMTPDQYAALPAEEQAKVEDWHFNDIRSQIRSRGLDQYIGQNINGVPMTEDGMIAVAHLGGMSGLSQHLSTQGAYNPSDELGTSLSDYAARHGGASATDTQMYSAGLADPEPEQDAGPDNLLASLLGVNQAERGRNVNDRVASMAEAAGFAGNAPESDGPSFGQSNFRLNLGSGNSKVPDLKDVRASNYQALAAEAEFQGDPDRATQITKLGTQMANATPEEQARMASTLNDVGQTLARVNASVIAPAQNTIDSFIGATDSAHRMMSIAAEYPDILTTVGGTVPALFSRIENEFNAFQNLMGGIATGGGSIQDSVASVDEFERTVAENLSNKTIDAQTAAYAMYNAQEIRLAFMLVRSQQGSGVISDADFRNALAQVRSSSRAETAEESLRSLLNADLVNVRSAQATLENDPQIRIAKMQLEAGGPQLENLDLFNGITRPIDELAESRGAGEAFRWVSGEITLNTQPTSSPDEQQNATLSLSYNRNKATYDEAISALRQIDNPAERQQLIEMLAETLQVAPSEAERVISTFGGGSAPAQEPRVIRRTYVPGEGVK